MSWSRCVRSRKHCGTLGTLQHIRQNYPQNLLMQFCFAFPLSLRIAKRFQHEAPLSSLTVLSVIYSSLGMLTVETSTNRTQKKQIHIHTLALVLSFHTAFSSESKHHFLQIFTLLYFGIRPSLWPQIHWRNATRIHTLPGKLRSKRYEYLRI